MSCRRASMTRTTTLSTAASPQQAPGASSPAGPSARGGTGPPGTRGGGTHVDASVSSTRVSMKPREKRAEPRRWSAAAARRHACRFLAAHRSMFSPRARARRGFPLIRGGGEGAFPGDSPPVQRSRPRRAGERGACLKGRAHGRSGSADTFAPPGAGAPPHAPGRAGSARGAPGRTGRRVPPRRPGGPVARGRAFNGGLTPRRPRRPWRRPRPSARGSRASRRR